MQRAVAVAVLSAAVAGQAFAQGAAAPAVAPKSWTDAITLKGDVRYRYEAINDDSKKDPDGDLYTRERNRVRARLSAEAKVNDAVKAGIGLSTGQSDPVSGNQTLGDGFAKKDMKLDLAYIDYNFFGDNPNEVRLIGGKMKNPFITFNDDLVWDGDLTPEGAALKARLGGEGAVKALLNGGYLWVQERSDRADAMLYAGQGALEVTFAPEAVLTAGVAYYGFDGIEGEDVIDWEGKNNAYGNSTATGSISGTTTNKEWKAGFTPIQYFAKLDLFVGGLPVAVFGQQIANDDADAHGDGFMYGVSVGRAKNPDTFEFGYSYAELEKDATLGMFTDSDRWGGGTDGKGHKLHAKYQLMKNLQAGVTYFLDERKISSSSPTDYDRLQVDLVASF